MLDNYWVKLPDGVVLIRLNEAENRGCIIKTKPGNNFSIETILQEKPGLWQAWDNKRYYTQNSAKELDLAADYIDKTVQS